MRKGLLFFSLVLLLILAGCSDPYAELSEEYNFETDYPVSFFEGSGGPFVAPAPGGYYAFIGQYLHFIDGETLDAVPLCNKPECRHMNESDSSRIPDCNAYFSVDQTPFLQYYEGKIYVSVNYWASAEDAKTRNALVRVSPDGENREYLCQLEKGQYFSYAIHRGYLYCYVISADGVAELTRTLIRNLRSEAEVLFTESTVSTMFRPLFYGNHLYLNQCTIESGTRFNNQIWDIDLVSGEKSPILGSAGMSARGEYEAVAKYQNSLLLVESMVDSARYDLCNLLTPEFMILDEYQVDMDYADGYSLMELMRADASTLYTRRSEYKDGKRTDLFTLKTASGEKELFVEELPSWSFFCAGDSKYMFLYSMDSGFNYTLYAMDKADDTLILTEVISLAQSQAFPEMNTLPFISGLD